MAIAPGLNLDYLRGDASGENGGTPRHQVEAQGRIFQQRSWRAARRQLAQRHTVNTLTGDDLRFSPLATFYLRLFANPGDIPELSVKHPWLRGSGQRRVDNIFNSRPRCTTPPASCRLTISRICSIRSAEPSDQLPQTVPAHPELVPPPIPGHPAGPPCERTPRRNYKRPAAVQTTRTTAPRCFTVPVSPCSSAPRSRLRGGCGRRAADDGLEPQSVAADQGDDDIVVKGKPPRGSVVGDILPEIILRSRDVKATGATSLDELLEAIAPDIGLARGSGSPRPLVLLNGRRVSSYRELRDIPIEAVSRVDILPAEVALKYGYSPDQKVVNVVLQNRFGETVALAAANMAAHDGYTGGGGDLTRILLTPKQRATLNLHAGTDDILRGSQRSLVEQQYESLGTGATGLLIPPELGIRGTATVSRELPGDVEATINAQAGHSNGHLLSGLSEQLPAQLRRNTSDDSLHLGGTLTGDRAAWHWNLTGNGDVGWNRTNTTDFGQTFAPGNAQSTRASGNIDATANGPLFSAPGGLADLTLRAAASEEYLDIDEQHFATPPTGATKRSSAIGAASIEIPISHRGRGFGALGNLTLSGNVEVNRLSDFGTLATLGGAANWSPSSGLTLIGSWNSEEQAPSVRQLGDPFVETPERASSISAMAS